MPKTSKSGKSRGVVTTRTRRPIDKSIRTIRNATTSAQQNHELMTATFPGTVTGLRWRINARSLETSAADSLNDLLWAIVVVEDGLNPSTIAFPALSTTPGNLYQPEQNVLAWGVLPITFEAGVTWDIGDTKTMRKLKNGDKLFFSYTAANTTDNNATVNGAIQYFYKS